MTTNNKNSKYKTIKLIDINKTDVYIEYSDSDSEYISFSRAEKLLRSSQAQQIKYGCADSEKSLKFLNRILCFMISDSSVLRHRKP